MRKYILGIAALGLAALLGGNGALGEAVQKSDKDKFQGTWTLESAESGGEKVPTEFFKDVKLVITGDKASMTGPKGEVDTSTFTLDSKKSPKTLDITSTSGKDKGMKTLAIYTFIDDNSFKVAMVKKGDRPKDFTTSKESEVMVMTFKCAK